MTMQKTAPEAVTAAPLVLPVNRQPVLDLLIKTGELNHHRYMISFGLTGALLGCTLGIVLLPHVAHRDISFPGILPIATTYIGLALGFFLAGVRKAILRESSTPKTINDGKRVHRVFADYKEAEQALIALAGIGARAEQLIVVGLDCDELRNAIAPICTVRFNKLILVLGAVGTVVGALGGLLACPTAAPSSVAQFVAHSMAGLCGALLGCLTGATVAAIVHVDNGPRTNAKVVEGSVTGGVVALSISPTDAVSVQAIEKVI